MIGKTTQPKIRARNALQTKQDILNAAQQAFSTRGYPDTGLRDIAAAAGITVGLVGRYFGSKESLFEAALTPLLSVSKLFDCQREDFGTHIVDLITENSRKYPNPVPMMVLATANPAARAIVERLHNEHVLKPLAKWLGPPNNASRAALITALCTGLTTCRDLIPITSLTSSLQPASKAWLASAIQAIVNESQSNVIKTLPPTTNVPRQKISINKLPK